MVRLFSRFALLTGTALCLTTPAHAMDITEALTAAYQNNPTLKAERKRMEAEFEAVPSAYRTLLPSVSGGYSNSNERGSINNGAEGKFHNQAYDIGFTQPLFRGGRTWSAMEQAEHVVKSATFALQNAEQRILLEAVDIYLNLASTREVYKLNLNNEKVLEEQLKATQERFNLGETTRTDVSQSESRFAAATSRRITAHGDLLTAESNFRRMYLIEPPEAATIPAIPPALPDNLESLLTLAHNHDPLLQSAYYNQEVAEEEIDIAKGVLLPTVNLNGSKNKRTGGGVGQLNKLESESLTLNVSVPFYQGGGEYSDLRRARKEAMEATFRLDQERHNTADRATAAWQSLTTARGAITAQEASVKSAELALEGVRQEQEVGSRTVLDVLDAEQELFQARVNLVNARRNHAYAAYSVLASAGSLTATGLHLPVEAYDPQEEYDRLEYKFFGL